MKRATPADAVRSGRGTPTTASGRAAEVRRTVERLIEAHHLPMRVLTVDVDDAHPQYGRFVAVSYTAPHRVDFRELLKDLARTLGARIDLRQVGTRVAAKTVGGIAVCGLEFCCSTFLTEPRTVTMRTAKAQSAGNPLAAHGLCDHLVCCTAFEAEEPAS